jgi:hypothetical protein
VSALPTYTDLGEVNPGSGERPIGSIDAQPIARGYERMAAGIERAGQGLNQFGANLSEVGEMKSRYDFALAHGGFLSDMIGLNENTSRDLNYGPDGNGQDLSQRYTAQANTIRDKWAGTIGSGPMQQRFTESVAPQIAEGQAHADTRSFNLYRDHNVAATDTLGEDLGNKGIASTDPNVHAQVMDAYGNAVDANVQRGFITADQGVAKKRAFGANLATGLILQQAEAQNDPLGALNHIRAAPGSDDELVERELQIEGFNPNGGSTPGSSHAYGYGQFEPKTWLPLLKQLHPDLAKGRSDDELLAMRADPTLGREMTKALLQQNRSALQGAGVDPTAGNLYLAHFLGAGDAAKVLKADPNAPVKGLISDQSIAANQSILAGRTAGSVIAWANNKMGGYSAGQGSIYSFIPPEQRARLESTLLNDVQRKNAADLSGFKQQYQDSVAESFNTGTATKPLALEDFVRTYGPSNGPDEFKDYQAQLQLGTDKSRVANMAPADQKTLFDSYAPQPGAEGYAEQVKRQAVLGKAIEAAQKERDDDPAAFAVRNLPASKDAWNKLSTTLSDPSATDDDKRAAARTFASITDSDQRRVGIAPSDVQILPQSYVDSFNKQMTDAATSDNPQSRIGLIGKVQQEAQMWGDSWPQIMRQLAPSTQPIVRAIAAGADPTAMTRLLSLDPKTEKPADLLKQSDTVKAAALTSSLDAAMAPFRSTLVGTQLDRDFTPYYGMANQLAALYVRDGMGAPDAAQKAFGDLIGNRYDFKDTYRIPKSAGVDADQVQAGALAARTQLGSFNVKPAIDDLGLGAGNTADSLEKFGRDGKWVTAPDQSGLNLAYGDKFVRTSEGAPLTLSWAQLAALGKASHTVAGANVPGAAL